MHSTRKLLLLVAGRSGGHIIPACTIAKQYQTENPETKIHIITTRGTLDKEIVTQETIATSITYLGIDNVPDHIIRYPLFLCQLLGTWLKSLFFLLRNRPHKVILMGGYISIPVCLAARLLRIPCELYELNAIPGKATKFLAPFARRIFLCFVQSKKFFKAQKSVVVPYPIRFAGAIRDLAPDQARRKLGLDPDKKTILILGGSQGSLFINNAIKTTIIANATFPATVQVIHQTGSGDKNDWQSWYRQRNISALVFGYHHDLSLHYQAADVIISRAGAGSVFEILFFQKKSIIIPLETQANDHQLHNALAIQASYAPLVTIIRQPDIEKNKNLLATTINNLLFSQQP